MKEYTIGAEALGRAGSFDPRQDNIVRGPARKLTYSVTCSGFLSPAASATPDALLGNR